MSEVDRFGKSGGVEGATSNIPPKEVVKEVKKEKVEKKTVVVNEDKVRRNKERDNNRMEYYKNAYPIGSGYSGICYTCKRHTFMKEIEVAGVICKCGNGIAKGGK